MYKILHKPTGLYFCPTREVKAKWTRPEDGRTFSNYVKSNLSKTGKVYTKRPTLKYIREGAWTHLSPQPNIYDVAYPWLQAGMIPFFESEWEIVEI
jgi:hypothetical protein